MTTEGTGTATGQAWGQSMNLYRSLNDEWAHLGDRATSRKAALGWAGADHRLAAFRTPDQIVRRCHQADTATANDLIAALLATGDPLALRACLEIFLPLVFATAERARHRGYCHPASPWPTTGDVDVELLAETWRWLRTFSGQTVTWPAPRLARQIWRFVARQAITNERRHGRQQLTAPACITAPAPSSVSADETCAALVLDAYRAGRLSQRTAQVLYGTTVLGDTIETVAARHGFSSAAARQDKRRNARTIAAAVA